MHRTESAKRELHIAIGSTMSKPGEVKSNLRQIETFAHRGAADGAALLLTPELSASGYGPYPEVLATAESAGRGLIYDSLATVSSAAKITICAGFVERADDSDGGCYLSHYAIFPDGTFAVQRKNRVTLAENGFRPAGKLSRSTGAVRSPDPADPGQPVSPSYTVFKVAGVTCGMVICADSDIPTLHGDLVDRGVELVLLAAAGGGARADRVTDAELATELGRAKYLRLLETVFFPREQIENCIRYGLAMAAVNLCGDDGHGLCHVGHGMIINPMGEVLALSPGQPNRDRQRPAYAHARVDVCDRSRALRPMVATVKHYHLKVPKPRDSTTTGIAP